MLDLGFEPKTSSVAVALRTTRLTRQSIQIIDKNDRHSPHPRVPAAKDANTTRIAVATPLAPTCAPYTAPDSAMPVPNASAEVIEPVKWPTGEHVRTGGLI